MRLALVVMLAAGCGFKPSVASDGGPGSGSGSDANLEAMPGAEPMPNTAPCFAPDTNGLVLCVELDDPGLAQARDGSPAHHDAMVMNTNVATRDVPATSQAAQILSTSVIQTGMSADFDVQSYTLMTWVHRENTPGANGRYGLVHALGQYYLAIDDADDVFCAVQTDAGTFFVQGPTTDFSQWDLVACTFDQSQLCAVAFPNGSTSGNSSCINVPSHPAVITGVAPGISVGSIAVAATGYTSHLAGKLDAVRIYSRVLDQQHICLAGGLTGC